MSQIEAQGFIALRDDSIRVALAVFGLILWLLFLVPPLSTWSSQYEFVQAIQFCSFAMLTPALLVVGRPWRWLGLASGEQLQIGSDGELVAPAHPRLLDRTALQRTKRPGHQRALPLLLVFMVLTVVWRLSSVVNAVARHPWLTIIESVTLTAVGVLFWIELKESRPLIPSATRPYRIAVAAVAMWTVWIIAYVMAMSHNSWNPLLRPGASLDLSTSADQQLTAALMWFFSAAVFLPLIFSNLSRLLQSEEDPSDELYQLVRKEQSRGFFGPKF